ncbi:sensor histidine kinase [Acidipropionibacterium acidipropionici]|jgi:signal transduction histidine kinase|uniref:histidine kinase n=1 Tax=Acidipropionibacterium acidipropionici TaxID=1748 RepID=A0AAC8YF92_9ACTN|nr:HAMP domain-containing sensor histidine kinase [Acidipropionibacterium acidipropionici]AMS05523.1 hypothetical protein AXH35_08775 [Acidipropionibacterium acidipropionici]AOZ46993.1 hypothetical protein A8L58_10215 [Acidipropionibacterium acidipropionici]AZP36911.1 sensor histidine kinase [Acidipropionibacterium acidipropionici]QCV93940.1 HAMP domain-containing histidine kinase [Acidipropionibacterium acidipropionici]
MTLRPRAADDRSIRSSTLRIGLMVGVTSALVIAGGIAILLWRISARSRPEAAEGMRRDHGHGHDHVVVDVSDVVPWLVVFGIAAVVLLGAIAWYSARRAVAPLAEALRRQRHFVADASHEMRTPLSALVSRTQILERRRARGEPIDDVIARLRGDAEAMSEVLTDLLTAAAADAGSLQEDAPDTPAHPMEALGRAAERMEPLASPHDVRIEVTGGSTASVQLAAPTLERICVALIDNAIVHSPQGGVVTVSCAQKGSTVEIRVGNQGPEISEEDRARVFERFARGAETGRHRGFGLGLALVREVATRARGSVEIEETSPAGTVFLLRLPAVS